MGAPPSRATRDGVVGALAVELRELRAYPHLDRAYRLLARSQLREARDEFERHLAIDPEHVEARTAYVMLLYRMKDHAEAVRQADVLLLSRRDLVDAWLYRGMAEQSILVMGRRCKPYLDAQRARAAGNPDLQAAIDGMWQRIVEEDR